MNNQRISETIKQARKSKGLTQQELADRAKLSLRTVQRIERGAHEISGYSLQQISAILQIPIEQMIMSNIPSLTIQPNSVNLIKNLYWLTLSINLSRDS